MQTVSTCLLFDDQALEAANFYTSLFPNSRIVAIKHYPEGGPRPAESVLTVQFTLAGKQFRPRGFPARFRGNDDDDEDRYCRRATGLRRSRCQPGEPR